MEGRVIAGPFQEHYFVESSQQIRNNENKISLEKQSSAFQQTPLKILRSLLKIYFSEK